MRTQSAIALIALLFFGCSAEPPAPQVVATPATSVVRTSGWTLLVFDSVGTSVEVPEIRDRKVGSNYGEITDVDGTTFSFIAEPSGTTIVERAEQFVAEAEAKGGHVISRGFLDEERYRPYYVFVERDAFAEHNRILAGKNGFFIATVRVPFHLEEERRDDILRSFRSIRLTP